MLGVVAAVVDAESPAAVAVAAADAEEEAAEQNWIAAGRTLSILCVSVVFTPNAVYIHLFGKGDSYQRQHRFHSL